jgi:hypothetical protein
MTIFVGLVEKLLSTVHLMALEQLLSGTIGIGNKNIGMVRCILKILSPFRTTS